MFEDTARRMVTSITDEDIIKLDAYRRTLSTGVSVDKMRLLRDQSTENINLHSEEMRIQEIEVRLLELRAKRETSEKITYNDPSLKSVRHTDVVEKLVFGSSYTVDELVERMIEYSDNASSLLLEEAIKPRDLKKTYDELGVPDPYYIDDQSGYIISTELYSSFFRILFNASYLSKENCKKALGYLSKTDYKKGLVAGVPPPIEVAHKFGLRKINGTKQLHDCGIVYYPLDPHLLCAMTSRSVPEYLDNTIAEISLFI